MAFSKAKIHRFNEVIGCAPPPGTYEPKWQEKPLLGVFEKGRRFNDVKPKFESIETPLKTPSLQKKERHIKSPSSRRRTCLKFQEDSFSTSANVTRSAKCSYPLEELMRQKTCSCNISVYSNSKKHRDVMDDLTDRLEVLSNNEATDLELQSNHFEKGNFEHDPNQEKVLDEPRSQSYQQEIIEYRLKIAELQDTIDCIMAEKNLLSMDYFKVKKYVDKLEEEIKMKNLKILEDQSFAESQRKSIETLKSEINLLKKDLEDSKFKVEELQSNFNSITDELSVERLAKEDLLVSYESALTFAREEVNKKCKEIEVLEKSLKEKQLAIDHEISMRNEQVENISKKLSNMEILYNVKQEKYIELEEELCKTRKELSATVSKEEELSSLRNGIESVLHLVITDTVDFKDINFVSKESPTVYEILQFFQKLIKEKNEVDLLNKELVSHIEEKELLIQNLEQLIGPFREQLENYEQERLALENLTKQTKGELETLSLQHAALLGHTNHKQKIQYMVKLKEKNLHLLDEIEDLRGKLRQKERIIAKLTNQTKDDPRTPSSKALHRSRKENAVASS